MEEWQKSGLPVGVAAINQFVAAALESPFETHLSVDNPPLQTTPTHDERKRTKSIFRILAPLLKIQNGHRAQTLPTRLPAISLCQVSHQ